MNKILFVLAVCISVLQLPAQTNPPTRLALVAESEYASGAADILTAQLSSHKNLQLLERNEIEKVYREQGLSAGNKDYLKFGQILGADGLLLLEVVRTRQATNLMARLIAVKPGMILTDGSFAWPLKDTAQWAESVSTYLDLFFPKLSVLAKAAIPISVVNLRYAAASAEGAEAERQLKLLAIQRLSQEKVLFVLERQRMQLLSEEKALKMDDSAFWNGSYLLEGIVDQSGYSKETITVNARLTPPKGGTPLLFEVSGSRTNLSDVINHLAAKVTELLKVNSNVPEWNVADEAAKYFDEAKWALRWGVLPEAQAAADSAWALGKRDLDCATVRVKAYKVPPDTGGYQKGEFTNPSGTNEVFQSVMEEERPNHIWGLTLHEQNFGETKVVEYVSVGKFPDPKSIDFAMRALGLYYEFSQTLPPNELKADSAWYQLGIEDLTVASQVLQHFHFVPESQKPAAEKLAELRSLARTVAGWMAKSPSIHDSYFVGDRVAVYDELYHFEESSSIFSLGVEYGFLWQERPEDCLANYRQLMSSPVFRYIHTHFWLRDLQTPRLVAWSDNDRQRIPKVWNNFIAELDASTNVLLQLEGKALALADADNESKMAVSFTNLFNCMFENRDALVANPVEVLYLYWGVADLVSAKTSSGIVTDIGDLLNHLFYSEYRPKLGAMDREYQEKTVPAGKLSDVLQQQKQYLKENKPYDFFEFVDVFQERDYSQNQAREIQPLIVSYKSNIVVQSQSAAGMQKAQLMGAIGQVGLLEIDVNRILNPPSQQPKSQPKSEAPKPPTMAQAAAAPVATNTPEVVANVIAVNKFLEIPLDKLEGEIFECMISAHHWQEGRLVLDLSCSVRMNSFDANGTWTGTGNAKRSVIAILDPATEQWNVIACPETDINGQNDFYHHTTFWRGDIFTSVGNQIRKYDTSKKSWQTLEIPGIGNCELFTVNDHLYAATLNMIVEILNGGSSTRILASNRRQPPISVLDTENLGTPALFAGPGNSLRVATANKIFSWNGTDWNEVCPAPHAPLPPLISDENILFLADGWSAPAGIWRLTTTNNQVEFCLGRTDVSSGMNSGLEKKQASLWKLPQGVTLLRTPVAVRGADLFLLTDHAQAQDVVDEKQHVITAKKILPQDGYHAAVFCFADNFILPQKLYFIFDDVGGAAPPVTGEQHPGGFVPPGVPVGWMCFGEGGLFLGCEFPDHFGGSWPSYFPKAGVWVVSQKQLDSEITRQKTAQRESLDKTGVVTRLASKALLEKFDRNHDGVIDGDEKEAALADEEFVASELDKIDSNHNGWIDAAELKYFDANQNDVLDENEQLGIESAQHLLAAQLLRNFDADADGYLNQSECNDLMRSGLSAQLGMVFFPDDNRDGIIDVNEVQRLCEQVTGRGLNGHGPPMRFYPKQTFKRLVDNFWQKTGGSDMNRLRGRPGFLPPTLPRPAPPQ